MTFRLAAMALAASLLAGAVIAHHPDLVRFGAGFGPTRRATAGHTADASQVYSIAGPLADQTSGDAGEAGSRGQSAPDPDFAGPGFGWG